MRRASPVLVLPALVLALAAGSCKRAHTPAKPNVFLISIDTLRADHLPAWGYKGVETPALDAFGRDALLFSNASSHIPLTLPAHFSVMTGLLPYEHGVRDNSGYRLKPATETLAELLAGQGYETFGAVSSIVLAGESGMKDGFASYEDRIEAWAPNMSLGRLQRDGGETAAKLLEALPRQPGKPLFGFLHLYEPHTPYTPPEPFRTRYAKSPYDGEIARADEILGAFFAELKSRGLYDDALIAVFSDHGEGLGEHGEDEHGLFLYRESLHIPLLLKLPGRARAGESVAPPVGLTDLFATVLAATGTKGPLRTASLDLREIRDTTAARDRRIYAETYFPRLHYGWAGLASLMDSQHHYIEAPRAELYDFVADPGELQDLSPALPPAFRSMRLQLSKMESRGLAKPMTGDKEQAAKLASLGYLSGGAEAKGADSELPDPKDKVGVVRELKEAHRLLGEGHPDEARAAFRALLAKEPGMTDVWNGLAQAARKAGRPEEALEALKEAAKRSPGTTDFFLAIANLAAELSLWEDARAHAELARDGGNPLAGETLATIALAEGNLAEAKRHLAGCSPARRFPKLLAARIAVKENRLAEAVQLLDTLLAETAGARAKVLMSVHQARADALARLGRDAEAVEAFERELALFPENLEAWQGLALLRASQGNVDALDETLARLMAHVPGPAGFLGALRVLETAGDRQGREALRRRAEAAFPADPRFRARPA